MTAQKRCFNIAEPFMEVWALGCFTSTATIGAIVVGIAIRLIWIATDNIPLLISSKDIKDIDAWWYQVFVPTICVQFISRIFVAMGQSHASREIKLRLDNLESAIKKLPLDQQTQLQNAVKEIQTRVDDVATRVDGNHTEIMTRVDGVATRVDSNHAEIMTRVDGVAIRVDEKIAVALKNEYDAADHDPDFERPKTTPRIDIEYRAMFDATYNKYNQL